jgi:hypothetical protein
MIMAPNLVQTDDHDKKMPRIIINEPAIKRTQTLGGKPAAIA